MGPSRLVLLKVWGGNSPVFILLGPTFPFWYTLNSSDGHSWERISVSLRIRGHSLRCTQICGLSKRAYCFLTWKRFRSRKSMLIWWLPNHLIKVLLPFSSIILLVIYPHVPPQGPVWLPDLWPTQMHHIHKDKNRRKGKGSSPAVYSPRNSCLDLTGQSTIP